MESTNHTEDPKTDGLGSGQMFDAIAERYDFVNRVVSLGMDQSWRRETVRSLEANEHSRVLDLATGTADLALAIAKTGSKVVGLDPSINMVEIGRTKVEAAQLQEQVELVIGNAEALEFEDDSFNGISIAFGIRNVPDRDAALREMVRVTKPGGRIAILELTEPRGVFGPFARFHVHRVVPFVGGMISGKQEYRYLERSIAAFPSPEDFTAQMERAGHEMVRVTSFAFGAATLFVSTPKELGGAK